MTVLTKAQRRAIHKVFLRNADGAGSYLNFRRRWFSNGEYTGAMWCGMFLGIERDGYCHS